MASTHRPGPHRVQPGRKASLNLPLDKISFIILKAREFDVKEGDSDPDEGSNAIDDGQTDVLADKARRSGARGIAGRDPRAERR